jgi:GT2 family glycosyltransferase
MTPQIEPLDPNSILPWEQKSKVRAAEDGFPGVSIVMPVYNAARFIEKTLRCLLLNDLEGCEIILMDGGSSDETMAIARHYAPLFTHMTSARDKGQSDAINRGFSMATKPILHWLNGDDILLPNALYEVRKAYFEHPETEVVVGNAYLTEIDFKPIHHFKFDQAKLTPEYLLDYARNHLVQPSVFFKRHAWDLCGPVREDLHYSMDADLFIRMSRQTKMKAIDADLAYSVYHEDCKTRGSRAEAVAELAYVQASHGGIEQAKNTVNVLVHEFNQLKSSIENQQPETAKIAVFQQRIKEMEEDFRKNAELMMLVDILEES